MKKYTIDFRYEVYGEQEIYADSEEEAIKKLSIKVFWKLQKILERFVMLMKWILMVYMRRMNNDTKRSD